MVSQPTLAQGVVTSASVEKGAPIASSPIAATTAITNLAHANSMANNLGTSSRIAIARGPAKTQSPQMRYAGCPNKTAKHVVSQLTLAQDVVTPASVEKGELNVAA